MFPILVVNSLSSVSSLLLITFISPPPPRPQFSQLHICPLDDKLVKIKLGGGGVSERERELWNEHQIGAVCKFLKSFLILPTCAQNKLASVMITDVLMSFFIVVNTPLCLCNTVATNC